MTPNQPPVYNGRYELRSQIARGGTAQVYLARDLVLDRPVALKVLFPEFATDSSFVERFRREGQAAANLSHPNIVPVFDWGESDRSYFIVMEYVDGEPLSGIIRAQAPLDALQAASIAADIAKALSYAHRHGVVHRDVKPGNVLITADGQVKVTDFGIARAIGTDEQVTQTGLVMGTATYFSPEQAQGLAVDGRSDIYALGVVLYEMVSGKPPFTGDNPVAIAYQHVREQPPSLQSVVPDLPPALGAIIAQSMAKLPAERYATAQDLQADLERFVHGITVLAAPPRSAFIGDGLGLAAASDVTQVVSVARGTTQMTKTAVPAVAGGSDKALPGELRSRSATPWWIAAAVLLLVGIGAAVFYGGRNLGYFGGSKFFAVPNVQGRSKAAAENTLRAKGLIPKVVNGPPSLRDSGSVVGQQPTPPTTVRKGDYVTIKIATSVARVKVPYVIGLSASVATQNLHNAGFKVSTRSVAATKASERQGSVNGQNPAAGTTRPSGSRVTILVYQGSKMDTVPNLAGVNQFKAVSEIDTAGLTFGQITKAFSPTVPSGDVISSLPTAGSKEYGGTPVTIIISKGPGVTIPNITGFSPSQADSALNALKFTRIEVRYAPTTVAGYVGNVLYTSPAAGKVVASGSVVIVVIGTGTKGNSGNSGNSGIIPIGNSGSVTTTSTQPTTTTLPGPPGPPGQRGSSGGPPGT